MKTNLNPLEAPFVEVRVEVDFGGDMHGAEAEVSWEDWCALCEGEFVCVGVEVPLGESTTDEEVEGTDVCNLDMQFSGLGRVVVEWNGGLMFDGPLADASIRPIGRTDPLMIDLAWAESSRHATVELTFDEWFRLLKGDDLSVTVPAMHDGAELEASVQFNKGERGSVALHFASSSGAIQYVGDLDGEWLSGKKYHKSLVVNLRARYTYVVFGAWLSTTLSDEGVRWLVGSSEQTAREAFQ